MPQPNAAPNVAPNVRRLTVGPAGQSLALRLPNKICVFDANVAR